MNVDQSTLNAMTEYAAKTMSDELRRFIPAEDIAQQAAIAAVKGEQPLVEGGELTDWAKQVIRHRIIDAYRIMKKKSQAHALGGSDSDNDSKPDIVHGRPDSTAGPATRKRREEALAALEAARGRLPADQQEVLELRYVHDLTLEETGLLMGLKFGQVRTLENKALANLASLMGPADKWSIKGMTSKPRGV